MYSKMHEAWRWPPATSLVFEPTLGQRHHLAGLDVAQEGRPDQVKGARLAGHAVGRRAAGRILDHPDRERPQPVRIAERDDRVIGHDDRREGAAQPWQHVGHRILDLLGRMGRQERRDDLRVRRRPKRDCSAAQLGVELDRVDQVAVVSQRQRAAVVADDRLGVLPLR